MGNKSSLMLRDDEIKKLSDETGFTPGQIEKLYSRFAHLDRNNLGSLGKSDLMCIPELAINPLCERLIQMFFSECNQGDDERINFLQFVKVLAAFKSSSASNSAHHHHKTQLKKTAHELNNDNNNNNNDTQMMKDSIKPFQISASAIQSNSNNQLHSVPIARSPAESLPATHALDSIVNESLRNKLLFVFKIYDADNDGRVSFGDLRNILKMMVGNYIEDVQLDKIATRAFVEVDQDSDGFIEFGEFCRVLAGKDLDDKLRVKFYS